MDLFGEVGLVSFIVNLFIKGVVGKIVLQIVVVVEVLGGMFDVFVGWDESGVGIIVIML